MSVSASAVMTWSINQIYKDFGVKIDSFIPTGYSKRGYQTCKIYKLYFILLNFKIYIYYI